jgi:hydrophobe/amphiphile efflux-3 (HAE3) family protein
VQQTSDLDQGAFATDSELSATLARVQDEFSAGGSTLQVVVDAGPGGDVLTGDGVQTALDVEAAIRTVVDDAGVPDTFVQSYASAVVPALAATTGADPATPVDPADYSAEQIDAAAAAALQGGAAQLMSSDADVVAGTAEAGIVIVAFPASLDKEAAADLSIDIKEAVNEVDPRGADVVAFNQAILSDELQTQSQEEMPRLLGLAMLLILGILMFQYRTFSDVAIGLFGLVAAIVWMSGISVLLGPDYVGALGPQTQISMIVPVLLVGLGIDYSLHLTSRYREEQSHGLDSGAAASVAVRTVGGALVLATVTTVVGFLTNLVTPLPPIADFGVITAVGVISAFIVMTTFVPSMRNLLDRRPKAQARIAAKVAAADDGSGVKRPASGLSRFTAKVAVLSERVPRTVLVVAAAISIAAAVAATQVGTTFSQEDFIPPQSDVAKLIDRIDELFGGELTETTFVVVEGDLATPAAANAQLDAAKNLADTEGVRSANGAAQVGSPAGLVAGLAQRDPTFAAEAAALGYTPQGGFADDADVAALYELGRTREPGQSARLVNADDTVGVLAVSTNAGQEGAKALAAQIERDIAPVRDVGLDTSISSQALVNDESLDALTSSQSRGIFITLLAAMLLLVSYYGVKERKPLLGLITMIPSIAVVTWVFGTMWLLGISFNVLTAMVTSLAIGIGVPFGIHVTHRFLEDRRRYDTVDEAVRQTATHTGGAMAGSAATTAIGFGVLMLGSLVPMRQFGLIVAITIVYSFIAAIIVQPACLKLWGEHRARKGDTGEALDEEFRRAGTTGANGTNGANGRAVASVSSDAEAVEDPVGSQV